MANKEEVIFKVKAELQGFKKSMEDLKKIAKDSSKNIEKAMSMDLTDEGSKAGKSFAKGMNKELKSVTNTLKNELKIMSDKTYTIKVKLDSSSVDRIKRDLSNIEIRVSASASGRASSSMSNNANAPNAANAMASMASTAALANLVTEVNKVAKTIQTTVSKVTESKVEVRTENVKVGVDTDGVKVGIDSDGVKVGVDAQDVKVGVNAEGVKVGVDTQNIQDIKMGVDTKDAKVGVDTKNVKVGVDAKGAKVGVDTYDTKVGVDVKDVKVGVDTKDSRVKIDSDSLRESVRALNGALNSLQIASEHTKDGADKIADVISKVTDLIKEIESAFNNGAKTVGTEIYESFNKSAQELYEDIVGLYKIFASKMNETSKSQVSNAYIARAREPRISNTIPPLSFGPYAHDFDIDKLKEAGKEFRNIQDIVNDVAKSTRETTESFKYAQSSINDVAKTIKKAIKGVSKSTDNDNQKEIKGIDESYKNFNSSLTETFNNGAKIIGDGIYEAFTKSAQELYQDIVELYKILTSKMSEASKNQNSNTTTNTRRDDTFGSISWNEQQKIKQRSPFEAPNSRTPFTKTSDLGNQYALFEIDKIKNADKAFQDIQNTISDVSKSMKEMLKEFSESIKQISDTIKKAFANDNHNQIAKEDSTYARRSYAKNSTGASGELEKINKQIKQWSNRLNTLKTRLNNAMDDETVEKYSSAINKVEGTLNGLYRKLEEVKRLNGFDELCMTVEDANSFVGKLRMNLQLLADDVHKISGEFKDALRNMSIEDLEDSFRETETEKLREIIRENLAYKISQGADYKTVESDVDYEDFITKATKDRIQAIERVFDESVNDGEFANQIRQLLKDWAKDLQGRIHEMSVNDDYDKNEVQSLGDRLKNTTDRINDREVKIKEIEEIEAEHKMLDSMLNKSIEKNIKEGVSSEAKQLLEGWVDELQKQINELSDSDAAVKSRKASLSDKLQKSAENIDKLSSEYHNSHKAASLIEELLPTIKDAIEEGLEDTVLDGETEQLAREAFSLMKQKLNEITHKLFAEVKETFEKQLQDVEKVFEDGMKTLDIRKEVKANEDAYKNNVSKEYGYEFGAKNFGDYANFIKARDELEELVRGLSPSDFDGNQDEFEAVKGELTNTLDKLESSRRSLEGKIDNVSEMEWMLEELNKGLINFASNPSTIKYINKTGFNKSIEHLREMLEELPEQYSDDFKKALESWIDGTERVAKKYVHKPTANERFEEKVKQLKESSESIEEIYENDIVKQGFFDTFKQKEEELDNQRKKDNITEAIKEFRETLLDMISDDIENSSSSDNIKQDYKQTLNTVSERLKGAFDKTSDENVVLELESALKQLEDSLKDAPVDDVKKSIAKNIANRIREQIEDAYKDISVDAVRSVISRVNGQNEGVLKLDDIKEDSIKDNDSSFDIEQLKEAYKVLKEVQDIINDIAKSMKAMLNDVLELTKQASASTKGGLGGDELSITLDDANDSVAKLRMNLQLLADDSEFNADDHVKRIRKEVDDIHEQISKQIDEGFKRFDKECEEKIRNSFNSLSNAIEQGAKAIDEITQKYGSNPIGEGKFDKESHTKIDKAYDNIAEKYNNFMDVIEPPEMGWYVSKDLEEEVNSTVRNALDALQEKIFELEKPLVHLTTVAENLGKLGEKLMNISDDAIASYKNRTLYNKLYETIGKQIEEITDDDVPVGQEETWKVLKEVFATEFKEGLKTIFKPMADDVFKEQKEQIDQMRANADESYGSEAIRNGLKDVYKKLEEQLDKERRINKSKETVDEFDREFVRPLISEINKSSSSRDVKQDYTQAINGIVERMNRAFGKDTHKDTVLEFEAALRQLEDRMEGAPAGDIKKDVIKHIINRIREQIENAYEAYNLDLEINLPVRSSLDVPAVINSIREQMDDVEQYVENNINLPIRSSLDVPDIRRNFDVIEVEFREIGDAADNCRGRFSRLWQMLKQSDAHVFTHKLGELRENLKKVSASIKDIGTPFKKAFNGISSVLNKILSPIKKVISGFRNLGNEAKDASNKVNGLTGSFKGLLGKLSMYFGIYEIFNLFKTGTQDAMSYEAAIINLQLTYGKASQGLIDFANNHAIAFGLSKRQVAEYGNVYSAIMRDVNRAMNPGASADAIAKQTMDMSQGILESAGIISSALGYDMEYVLEGLRSGLLGSSEAVDQFGLSLKRANLENSQAFKEVANGVTSWEKLTVEQQQYIIAQEIINQTASKFGSILDENGKIMKTTASLHTQFLAQWQNTKLAVGNLGKVIWTAILPPLIKILAILEQIFNYAASAMTMILEMFNIKVDLNANLGGNSGLDSLGDTANDTSDALNGVGDSAQDTAQDTEDAAKKIKRALAGFDQINVLTLGDDAEDSEIETPELGEWNPTPIDPGEFGVQLPDLSDEFKDKLKKLKELFDEFMEPFKAAWDELGERWIQAWNRLKESFKGFCESLADFLASVWKNGGKEFVQHMAEIALAVGIAAMEIGGTILDSLAKLWKHLDPETNMNTQGFLDALNEAAVKLRDLILDLNTHFESLMKNGGQDVLNALGDMFMNLGESATRGVGVTIDAIDGLLDHLDPSNNDITRGMLEMWENAFLAIGQAALAFADLMESSLANGGQGVINALGDLGVQILSTLGSITTDVAEACANLFAHLDPANNDITAGALEGFKYFVDSIRNFIEMLGESFSTFMDNGGQEFLNNMADIALILFDMAATIGGDLLNSITAFFNSFAGQTLIELTARTLELLSSILKGLLEILEPLTPIISAVVAAIGGFMVASKVVTVITTIVSAFQSLGSVLGLAKAGVSALWAIIAANPIAATVAAIVAIGVALVALYNKCEWFRDAVNKVFERLAEPIEKLKETFSKLFENVVDVFQNIIDFIVGIFTGDGERAGKAVREFVINIGEILLGLFELRKNLAEIGWNLILGLVEGIWECIKNLPQLLVGIGEFVVDFFKGLFGIHSPSTVFAELGGYLIEGLAQGITDSLNLLENVFSGVSDAINGAWDKVKTAWSEASDFFGGVWQSVKDTFDKIKDMSIPKPKIEWDVIKETASKTVDKVKETVEKFKADLPKPKISWDNLTTSLSKILDNLKRTISNFKWELPKPKLPSFSVSGGRAPWGFMGQGSLPSIKVKWNAQGGIMNSPTIFGMTGNTLLGGGEAGAEAILPLDELWNRLDNSFQQQNQALSRAIASSNNGSNRPVNVVLKVNDIEMGKVVVNSLKSLSNHSGGSLDLPFNK